MNEYEDTGASEHDIAEPQPEGEVIGDDERRRVTDTLRAPYRWICAIDLFVDDPLRGKGAPPILLASRATGVLIGPRHVLTAAHIFNRKPINVQGREIDADVTRVRVSPARNGDNDAHPFGAATSTVWRRSRHGDDYALIVLDQDVSQRTAKGAPHALGWWALRRLDPAALGRPAVEVTGYPGDRCGNDAATGSAAEKLATIKGWVRTRRSEWASTLWRGAGRAQIVSNLSILVHTADTYQGQSGAPVCVRSGDTFDVLGVHGGEVTPADGGPVLRNRGVRVTRRMLAELAGWINSAAGREWARVDRDALVFAAAPAKETSDAELDPGGEYESRFEFDSSSPASDLRLIGIAARKIDAGLRLADAALPKTPAGSTRELVAFIVSLLRTYFFPRGHGKVSAARKVLAQSARARIEMTIEKDDGSRWPFEHRVLLWLTPRRADRAWVGGEHGGSFSSSITLYVPDYAKVAETSAASIAIHESVHMLFRLIDRLGERHGDAVVRRFLARQPWRALDERPLAAHRDAIAALIEPLRKLLPMQVSASELAASLVREAFAYTLSQWVGAAIDAAAAARTKGPKIVLVSIGIAPTLVRHYVLERSPSFVASLTQPEVDRAVKALAPALEALADELHKRWGPAFPLDAAAKARAREAAFSEADFSRE